MDVLTTMSLMVRQALVAGHACHPFGQPIYARLARGTDRIDWVRIFVTDNGKAGVSVINSYEAEQILRAVQRSKA